MPTIITAAGETAIAQAQATQTPLEIAEVVFYDVPVGGSNPTTPERDDVEPDPADLVHTEPITRTGFVSPDAVVFSVMLDTSIGDFTFTWMGWKTTDGVLFAITHTTPQYKRMTSGSQVGNNFTRSFVLAYQGASELTQITVPAETWQLDFSERLQSIEEERRLCNKAHFGRIEFFGDAFKVSAIAPQQIDTCENITNWSLSGGQGSIAVDGVDFNEGTGSLKASGQADGANMLKDVSTAPLDLSVNNGLLVDIKGGSATNLSFFVEDSVGNRDKWNFVNQTAWTTFEFKLDQPDVNGGCDYSSVHKFGIEGLDVGVVYNLDNVRVARFNDFALEAGEAFAEGIRLNESASTYENHNNDYNQDATLVQAISPPGSGTRFDSVYLDVHLQGNFNLVEPRISVVVSDQAQADYVDPNGYQHYVEKIAEITRTTSEQITTSMIVDFRTDVDTRRLTNLVVQNEIDVGKMKLANDVLKNTSTDSDLAFDTTGTGQLILRTGGSERMRVNDAGQIGIGDFSSRMIDADLHIAGSSNVELQIGDSDIAQKASIRLVGAGGIGANVHMISDPESNFDLIIRHNNDYNTDSLIIESGRTSDSSVVLRANGDVDIGRPFLPSTSTSGFLGIPIIYAAPSEAPSLDNGFAQLCYKRGSSNGVLYIYDTIASTWFSVIVN